MYEHTYLQKLALLTMSQWPSLRADTRGLSTHSNWVPACTDQLSKEHWSADALLRSSVIIYIQVSDQLRTYTISTHLSWCMHCFYICMQYHNHVEIYCIQTHLQYIYTHTIHTYHTHAQLCTIVQCITLIQ